MDVWLKPEVALAQKKLILEQLQDPLKIYPFYYFVEAMKRIPLKGGRMLDVGCGVGHYGLFVEKFYPTWEYFGSDSSPAMIEQARDLVPLGHFRVCDFMDNDFESYDLVVISQVMEQVDDPWPLLDRALLRTCGYLVLHRLRLIKGYSRQIQEKTYLGLQAHNYEWNMKQFVKHLGPHEMIPWTDLYQYTVVVAPA